MTLIMNQLLVLIALLLGFVVVSVLVSVLLLPPIPVPVGSIPSNNLDINLFGLTSPNGVATAARCLSRCLEEPIVLLSKPDNTLPNPHHVFDISVNNADQTPQLLKFIGKLNRFYNHRNIFSDHYRIGVWHWETSSLPLEQGKYGSYYNELWVPSRYIADAILSTSTFPSTTRVFVLPYGFENELPPVTDNLRRIGREQISKLTDEGIWSSVDSTSNMRQLGSSDSTIFLVAMDFLSDHNRKNILGSYDAFVKAFPLGERNDLALVIKTVNHKHTAVSENVELIKSFFALKNDPRVHFISKHLSFEDLFSIKYGVDCYISLHRSEGWGFNLFEAILMGIPVIASAYGGSEQFMRPLYSQVEELRVPAKHSKISKSFMNAYTTDMYWGEPDVEAAATALRLLEGNTTYYRQAAVGIRSKALDLFSRERLGQAMKDRLSLVFNCACLLLNSKAAVAIKDIQVFREKCMVYPPAELSAEVSSLDLSVDYCKNKVLGYRQY